MNKCLKLLPFRSERLWSMWTRSLFITDWNELCTSPIWSNQISLWEFHLQYGAKLEPHHRSTIWRQLCEGRWMSREMLCGEKKKGRSKSETRYYVIRKRGESEGLTVLQKDSNLVPCVLGFSYPENIMMLLHPFTFAVLNDFCSA